MTWYAHERVRVRAWLRAGTYPSAMVRMPRDVVARVLRDALASQDP